MVYTQAYKRVYKLPYGTKSGIEKFKGKIIKSISKKDVEKKLYNVAVNYSSLKKRDCATSMFKAARVNFYQKYNLIYPGPQKFLTVHERRALMFYKFLAMNDVAEIAAKKAVKQISMKTKDITVFQIAREAAYAKQRLQITKVDIAYPVTYNYSINDAFWSAFVAVDNVLNNLEHRKECSEKILKRIEKEKDRLRDYDDTLIES